MVTHLRGRFGDGMEIIHQDILTWEPTTPDYTILGNIPYYITSPIIFRYLYDVAVRPSDIVLTMQAEVADRILATDGHSSYLSIAVACACESVSLVTYIPRTDFEPIPDVDSAAIVCHLRPIDRTRTDPLLAFVRAAFAHPRKKLVSNLASAGYGDKNTLANTLESLGIRGDARAEMLDHGDFEKCYERVKEN